MIAGKGESGAIVCTPEPEMSKSMVLVAAGGGVGIEDRLAERAGAAVAGVGDQEGRQQRPVFHPLEARPRPEPDPVGGDRLVVVGMRCLGVFRMVMVAVQSGAMVPFVGFTEELAVDDPRRSVGCSGRGARRSGRKAGSSGSPRGGLGRDFRSRASRAGPGRGCDIGDRGPRPVRPGG